MRISDSGFQVSALMIGACLAAIFFVGDHDALAAEADGPIRIIIETDAGGDPDDEQSLVRFLLYTNEWDVEGIIPNRPHAREGENLSPIRDGVGIVRAMIDAYGKCHASLAQHDKRFPTAEKLQKVTVNGYEESDAGVRLIIEAVDRDDPRPVWFCNWGTDDESASSSLLRALDRVRRERGQEGYAKFKNKLRLASYDKFGEHTKLDPPWRMWVQTWEPELNRQRWYHRFSGITATAGGFDIERDVRRDHGPLGAMYPTNTTHPQKEGDTACFLYLIPTGMNDPHEPTWGSWAGRYGQREDFLGKPYYWANVKDTWNGKTHRESTLARWAADLQNDFRARMDWCVRGPKESNHAPVVVISGQSFPGISRRKLRPGVVEVLDAGGTKDPDGDKLTYQWFVYDEAGTYGKPVKIAAETKTAAVEIPEDAAGKTIHVVLRVVDGGNPPLARYGRVVYDVAE